MYYYKIYGKRLQSDYELPQLLVLSEEEQKLKPEIIIRADKFPKELLRDYDSWSDIKRPVATLSNRTCLLYVTADEIKYELREGCEHPSYLNSYLLGWGLSMLFYERGELAIHCSCVANENGAVIISGNSGCGKSTVTAHFLDNGYHLMADDVSVVQLRDDGAYATPAFPAQKFCRDVCIARNLDLDKLLYINEEKDKFLVPWEGEYSADPVKVRCMIVLSKSDAIEAPVFEEMSGLSKFFCCQNSLFLRPLLKKNINLPENSTPVLKMASLFPLYAIARPTEKDTKKEVLELIDKIL